MVVFRPALPTQHQHRGRPPPPRTPLGTLRPRHDRPPGHRRPGTPQRVLVRGRRRGHRRSPRAHFHPPRRTVETAERTQVSRSEEHTSELQSRPHLVCRLLLEKKKINLLILTEQQYTTYITHLLPDKIGISSCNIR